VTLVEDNNINSLEDLYERYKGMVHGYIYRLVGDPQVADDLTQETFYQACVSIYRFRKNSSIKTWLYSIARNRVCSYLKKRRRSVPITDQERFVDFSTPFDTCERNWKRQLVV